MRITYWVAECLNDSRVYSIRAETRRECKALKAQRDEDGGAQVGEVHKVQVDYSGAFDLLRQCLDEGGINEGS